MGPSWKARVAVDSSGVSNDAKGMWPPIVGTAPTAAETGWGQFDDNRVGALRGPEPFNVQSGCPKSE